MLTEYTMKDSPTVVTLDVNTNSSRSQGNPQPTDMNDDETVEAGNKK